MWKSSYGNLSQLQVWLQEKKLADFASILKLLSICAEKAK